MHTPANSSLRVGHSLVQNSKLHQPFKRILDKTKTLHHKYLVVVNASVIQVGIY